MPSEDSGVDVEVLTEIVQALNKLSAEDRHRMVTSVAALYGIRFSSAGSEPTSSSISASVPEGRSSFSEDRSLSAKEFIWHKQPRTAMERVVCLAYYLAHYRGMKQFKTTDIVELNMEAAQIKFSNPTMMVAEATRHGYLVPAGGQFKQLSLIGEQFVRLLPDRQAAIAAIKNLKPRRSRRKSAASSSDNERPS